MSNLKINSNLHDFNNKIDMTKVIKSDGRFYNCFVQRINPFGEFICTPDFNYVGNIFNVFENGEGGFMSGRDVYAAVLKEHPEYLREPVIFTEFKAIKIEAEEASRRVWTKIIEQAKHEMKHKKYVNSDTHEKYTMQQYFITRGETAICENDFGHLSRDLINSYPQLRWSVLDGMEKPIILPHWHTPKHLSFVEVFDAFDPTRKYKRIYEGENAGWAGKLGYILADKRDLFTMRGSTWNYTQDFWNTDKVTLDFNCEPLDLILEKNKTCMVKDNLLRMTKEQILFLQEKFKDPDLLEVWKAHRECQYTINQTTYYKRANGYYMYSRGLEQQLTNFTMTFKKRIKIDEHIYYIVEAVQGDNDIILTIPSSYFSKLSLLKEQIREKFLDANLEMPKFYTPLAEHRLSNLIFDYFDY